MPGMLQPERCLAFFEDGRCEAAVRSLISGKWHHQVLRMTRAEWDEWQAGNYIQRALPRLSSAEREFLMTGATAEEWDNEFSEDDE